MLQLRDIQPVAGRAAQGGEVRRTRGEDIRHAQLLQAAPQVRLPGDVKFGEGEVDLGIVRVLPRAVGKQELGQLRVAQQRVGLLLGQGVKDLTGSATCRRRFAATSRQR